METVEQKAARLVASGNVHVDKDTWRYTQVTVQGDSGTHTVLLWTGSHDACTCRHGQLHHGANQPCSHILAARIYLANSARALETLA